MSDYTTMSVREDALKELQDCVGKYMKVRPTLSEIILAGCAALKEHDGEMYIDEIRSKQA